MAVQMLPILLIGGAAVAALVASGSDSDTGIPEPEGAGVLPTAEMPRDGNAWKKSHWERIVDKLAIELSSPHDVAVMAGKRVFPRLPFPPEKGAPPANIELWKMIRDDVWSRMLPGERYPID